MFILPAIKIYFSHLTAKKRVFVIFYLRRFELRSFDVRRFDVKILMFLELLPDEHNRWALTKSNGEYNISKKCKK